MIYGQHIKYWKSTLYLYDYIFPTQGMFMWLEKMLCFLNPVADELCLHEILNGKLMKKSIWTWPKWDYSFISSGPKEKLIYALILNKETWPTRHTLTFVRQIIWRISWPCINFCDSYSFWYIRIFLLNFHSWKEQLYSITSHS